MNPGILNKRIVIKRQPSSKDSKGRTSGDWIDVATVWASVEPLSVRDVLSADKVNYDASLKIRIRYRTRITADMRIAYGNRIFQIVAPPIDYLEQHKELLLLCKELVVYGN